MLTCKISCQRYIRDVTSQPVTSFYVLLAEEYSYLKSQVMDDDTSDLKEG